MKEFKFFKGHVSNLFESIAFPMVRRVGARLIGDELVPVQPIEELPQPRTITRRIPNQNVGEIIWIDITIFHLLYLEDGNNNIQRESMSVSTRRTTLNSFLTRYANDYIFVYNISDRDNNIYSSDNINELSGQELVNMRASIFKREIVV